AIRFTKGMRGGSQIRSKITFSKNIEDLEKIMNDAYMLS
ncbi:MAG: tRNA dihydrouridine synthase DusB, partial [Nitrosopumilus sp.]